MIAASPLAVLEQALDWLELGESVALVTLVGIEGSASRSLGTQMAVTSTGRSIGSFSGGCIETAIVAEAQKMLEAGFGRTVRFGLGSPYIDVRLPCGGGIDLLFTPRPSPAVLREAIGRLQARQSSRLFVSAKEVGWSIPGFALDLFPPLRIVALGQGEDLSAFVRLAASFGAEIEAHSPQADLVEELHRQGHAARPLSHLNGLQELTGDPWTAFVFLFHDRDWEDALLPHALCQPALFFGAIGSQKTHAARIQRLRSAGCSEAALAKLSGHIGLIPATRDPATLAVSILAELADRYAQACAAEPAVTRMAIAG
ncbi:MAG: XdhC family protein [Novosphingobium sp.]